MRRSKKKFSFSIEEKHRCQLKRVTLLVFICSLCYVNGLFANVVYHQSVSFSLNLNNVTMEEVFNTIRKQSQFEFFYNNDQIDTKKKVSINVKNANLTEILSQVLGNQYEYRIEDRYVLIKRKPVRETKAEPAQSKTIQGKVVDDATKEPLIGVSVSIPETSLGTVTDIDGNYSLSISNENALLHFSYLGYASITVSLAGKTVVNVSMKEMPQSLDEVVVVGYGVQKKVNLTGAVSAISGEEISARPITNVSSGLQGLLPGVTVISNANGGLPGQSSATIRVRGVNTSANSNPLILIDGVEGDMNIINPEDIESISVLKDAASAAIYGNRAANGVILITTKMPNKDQTPQINFNAYWGLQTPTRLPEMADAATFMKWDTEANLNVGSIPNYTEEDIQKVINGTDPNYYANTNWIDEVFKSSAPQQNYNVSITGHGNNMGYLLSYGYLEQDGLTVGNSTLSKRNNIRLKLNTRVAEILDVSANISYIDRNYSSPSSGYSGDGGIIYNAMRTRPIVPVRFTDGRWGYGGGQSNQVALLHDGGYNQFRSQETTGNFVAKIDLLKGWTASANYTFVQSNSLREILYRTVKYFYPETEDFWYATTPTNSFENRDYTTLSQTFFAQTDYEIKIDKSTINVLAGYSQEWSVSKNFTARRDSITNELNPSLEFGSNKLQSNSASASQWAMRSGFGRLNYNYGDRYLFEANIRYDLTSRFAKNNRGGWFPSVSGAWRISEEDFMKEFEQYVNNLKLRLSWGILGNQFSTNNDYPYLSTLVSGNAPNIGAGINNGTVEGVIGNPNLRWEKSRTTNIGLDFSILNTRLNFNIDYYYKKTKDIIASVPTPNQGGFSSIEKNSASYENKGWDLQIMWKDRIGKDFKYGAGLNLSDVRNKVVDLGEASETIGTYNIVRQGESFRAFYGLIADGIAMPWDFESYNPTTGKYTNPKFPIFSGDQGIVQPGDIKYKDLDNSGSIDLDNDRAVIGSNIPRYSFNFNAYANYKGFDLSITLQGVGKVDGYITGAANQTFTDQSTYPQKIHEGRYQNSNPNPNASYPRFTYNQSYNQRFSTFWLEDASYLRIKNLQVGYTLPDKLTEKWRINKCRFYASADNLATFTDFYYAYDPETPVSSGGYYPQVKTFVFGVNVTFK